MGASLDLGKIQTALWASCVFQCRGLPLVRCAWSAVLQACTASWIKYSLCPFIWSVSLRTDYSSVNGTVDLTHCIIRLWMNNYSQQCARAHTCILLCITEWGKFVSSISLFQIYSVCKSYNSSPTLAFYKLLFVVDG